MTRAQTLEPSLILLAVFALGFSCVITQLALMRELLAAFSGNEMVLGIVLGLWLLLMGMGTGLGRTSEKLRNPAALLVVIQILVAVLPLLQVFVLRAFRNVIFVRGATASVVETVVSAFVLLLPYCLAAGYALTLACSILLKLQRRAEASGVRPAGGTSSRAAGGVYVADSLGSIGGGVLFSFVLLRSLDHIGMLVYPCLFNLLLAWATGFRIRQRALAITAAAIAVGVSALALLTDPDAVSTGLQFSRQHLVARANSPYGKLLVTESDGQLDFIENGVPLTSTRDDQHVEETVHYAMAQRPDARRVLLVAGGISGTAKEILKYGVDAVDYVELDPLILEFGRKYLPQNLADSRIRIINTDGRLFLKQTRDKYDVIIVDAPDPSTAQLNRFYTAEFFGEARRALSPGGLLSFSLGHYENYVSPELARLLASARRSVGQSFRNVLMIPGGRVFFLASDGPLFDDIALRIEQQRIKTRLMNRHYLDAMLTTDRMLDMERAAAQPAGLNEDFSPVLYYYHLRHWLSQFQAGLGVLPVLLAIFFCIYLARLRGAAFALFASGFAGTGLEMVLLLVFQILCGSLYRQVGIIVTVFMAGLAAGAVMTNRLTPEAERSADLSPLLPDMGMVKRTEVRVPKVRRLMKRGAGLLTLLALAIAGYAILLPVLLPLLKSVGGLSGSLWLIQAIIACLTLALAVPIGMQFPLANRLESDGTVSGASRFYTADFLGAFLGALLVSAWLLPLIGVTGVCLLVGAVNLVACLMIHSRKAVS
jgi:spermidine synthase